MWWFGEIDLLLRRGTNRLMNSDEFWWILMTRWSISGAGDKIRGVICWQWWQNERNRRWKNNHRRTIKQPGTSPSRSSTQNQSDNCARTKPNCVIRNNFYSTSRRHQQSPARRHPTEPAQIAVQEEFAESISSQEVQPEFLLQSSQENFSGTVPSDPPVLVPISRLSSQENFSSGGQHRLVHQSRYLYRNWTLIHRPI